MNSIISLHDIDTDTANDGTVYLFAGYDFIKNSLTSEIERFDDAERLAQRVCDYASDTLGYSYEGMNYSNVCDNIMKLLNTNKQYIAPLLEFGVLIEKFTCKHTDTGVAMSCKHLFTDSVPSYWCTETLEVAKDDISNFRMHGLSLRFDGVTIAYKSYRDDLFGSSYTVATIKHGKPSHEQTEHFIKFDNNLKACTAFTMLLDAFTQFAFDFTNDLDRIPLILTDW